MEKSVLNYILKWNRKIKAFNLKGSKCEICGDDNINHLIFHHKNPNDKEINITELIKWRWDILEKEVDKCILLCDNCHRELHYNMNKNLTKSAEIRRNSKNFFMSFKGDKCEICGYDKCKASLVFHHKDGFHKEFEIGHFGKKITSLEDLGGRILDELEKCMLVCSNCHRDLHHKWEMFNKYKDDIYNREIKWIQPKIDRNKVIEEFKNGNNKIVNLSNLFNCSKGTMSLIIKELKDKRLI